MSVALPSGGTPVTGEAWLVKGGHTFHGRLELTDERLSFVVDGGREGGGGVVTRGKFSDAGASWLANQTADPTASERAKRGEEVVLFDIERQNAEVRFAALGLGITMRVKLSDAVARQPMWWVFYLVRPTRVVGAGGGLYYLTVLRQGRRASEPFRKALK
jgi:hypothetical protein